MNKPTVNLNVQKLPTAEEIQAWLVAQIAEQLGIEFEEIDVRLPFDSYGLDSAQAMSIAAKGEEILGFQPAPVLMWHYPTIESLSERLAEELEDSETKVWEVVDRETLARELAEIEQLSPEQVQNVLNFKSN
jgi:acyl carrier protein